MTADETICVVGDLHLAKIWDSFDRVLADEIASGNVNMQNPNTTLKRVIDEINLFTQTTVIFNGDSVDYYFASRNGREATNWDLFYEILDDLERPFHLIPGNHDYRKEPYSFLFYDTTQINVPRNIFRTYAKQIGHNGFRGFREFESILVNEARFDPLEIFRERELPREEIIGQFHCVFLDSGSDAIVRPRNFVKYFRKCGKKGKFSLDLDGLKKKDINFVTSVIDGASTVYIFMHGPIINPWHNQIGREYDFSSLELANGVILNGGQELVDVLRESSVNPIVVASHTHKPTYMLIHKQTLMTTEVGIDSFNEQMGNSDYIKHATTLPLMGRIPNTKTGYLVISKNGLEERVVREAFKY